MSALSDLVARLRDDADTIERYGDRRTASLLRTLGAEVLEAVRVWENEPLTLAEAASEDGAPSYDHLRHQVSSGKIPNAGRKGAPRVRRCDVPRKAGARKGDAFNAEAVAADIVRKLA